MPALPSDPVEAERIRLGTIKGLYRFTPDDTDPPGSSQGSGTAGGTRVGATILFSGSAWQAATEARRILAADWGVDAEVWSVTSYKSLREEAISTERWNRLHPGQARRVPFVTQQLAGSDGPIVAVTDFMRSVPDQISRWMPRDFTSLGTDGFGRSDTRDVLRRFFEVDAAHVVVAVLNALAGEGALHPDAVHQAIDGYGIDPGSPDPWAI